MDVDPSFAANEAASVTQKVAAITLNNSRNPGPKGAWEVMVRHKLYEQVCEKNSVLDWLTGRN